MTISTPAAPGDVDTSFGNNGSVIISDCVPLPTRVRIQPDGKIVTAAYDPLSSPSESFISRHNANGSPDIFGNNGCGVGVNYLDKPILVYDLVISPDGHYLAAGYNGLSPATNLALYRFRPDGTLENQTFWQGNLPSIGERIAIQTDGKVVIGGHTNGNLLLVRFNADGTIDDGFGTGGSVITQFARGVKEVLIQGDGKIIAAGNFGIVRFSSNGRLDKSFGTGGYVNTGVNTIYFYQGAALQTDGKVVFNSRFDTSTSVIKRYNSDGTSDTSFGINGTVSIAEPQSGGGIARAIAIQKNGKILTAGSRSGSFAISRYNTNGTIDTNFGTNGVAITPIGPFNEFNSIFSLEIQPDGKVIASGLVSYNFDGSGMVRYETETPAINVGNVEELYAAVNNPQNIGRRIIAAPGVYFLSAKDPNNVPRPNGGRLELQEDMSLQGVVNDRGAVVIDAINLPNTSVAALRIGKGSNTIEWLTIQNSAAMANIDTDLIFPGTAIVRIAHIISSGSSRGINIRNFGPEAANAVIDAELIDNEVFDTTEGIRIINQLGANGGVITARLSGNRGHDNGAGLLVVNNRSDSAIISVTSTGDQFYQNALGASIIGGLSSGSMPANGNTVNFTAQDSTFENNTNGSFFDLGGLLVVGGENLSFANGTSNNTVNVALTACPTRINQFVDLYAAGARSNPESIGAPGSNNHVTITRFNIGPDRVRQAFFNSIPNLPGLMNTVSVIDNIPTYSTLAATHGLLINGGI